MLSVSSQFENTIISLETLDDAGTLTLSTLNVVNPTPIDAPYDRTIRALNRISSHPIKINIDPQDVDVNYVLDLTRFFQGTRDRIAGVTVTAEKIDPPRVTYDGLYRVGFWVDGKAGITSGSALFRITSILGKTFDLTVNFSQGER